MSRTHTYTYAEMEVTRTIYDEIARKLREGGYHQAFHEDSKGKKVLDMTGIGLTVSDRHNDERRNEDQTLHGADRRNEHDRRDQSKPPPTNVAKYDPDEAIPDATDGGSLYDCGHRHTTYAEAQRCPSHSLIAGAFNTRQEK